MNDSVFRKKSIDKVSSPEQLNDYIRVSNPGVWMLMSAIIILLVGICVWGIYGHLETKMATAGVCRNGILTCYVKQSDGASVKAGMPVVIDKQYFTIKAVGEEATTLNAGENSALIQTGGFFDGETVIAITADAALPDGVYTASIITESLSPISFVTN
jgi:hypothetical protein